MIHFRRYGRIWGISRRSTNRYIHIFTSRTGLMNIKMWLLCMNIWINQLLCSYWFHQLHSVEIFHQLPIPEVWEDFTSWDGESKYFFSSHFVKFTSRFGLVNVTVKQISARSFHILPVIPEWHPTLRIVDSVLPCIRIFFIMLHTCYTVYTIYTCTMQT